MSSPSVITAENMGKCYAVRGSAPPTLLGTVAKLFRRQKKEVFWALRDVSFAVQKGQTVGVIGPNGSGKSSTLGLVAGTISPTEGTVRTEGRISTLLELGAGFHPELTGRENVFLNASILDIPHEDIRQRLDHIIAFSGLADFIDMPVKNYSSGMYVRLGFAVAVEMKPDILLVDEVLAVGDIAFQLKCIDRIRQFQKQGKTILFVSHALDTVKDFCDEAYLIYDGKLAEHGDPEQVCLDYVRSYMGEGGVVNMREIGTREAEITGCRFIDDEGKEPAAFTSGKHLVMEISFKAHQRIEKPIFGFSIKTSNGFYVYGSNTQNAKQVIDVIEGEGVIRLRIDPLTLMQGNYFVSLSLHSWDHLTNFHRLEDYFVFAVKDASHDQGVFQLPHRWEYRPPEGGKS